MLRQRRRRCVSDQKIIHKGLQRRAMPLIERSGKVFLRPEYVDDDDANITTNDNTIITSPNVIQGCNAARHPPNPATLC